MAGRVWAVVPLSVMDAQGNYGPDWKVWCQHHDVSPYRFLREAQRRRARFGRA